MNRELICLEKALANFIYGGVRVDVSEGESYQEASEKLDYGIFLVDLEVKYSKIKIKKMQALRRLIRQECKKLGISPKKSISHY